MSWALSANRLISVISPSGTTTYAYDGLGERYRETVNGQTTTYTLDLAGGLTQVLDDGTNKYIYGLGRIAQTSSTDTEYFLGDALGSVRQLTDSVGTVTLAQSYDPFGNVTISEGTASTSNGFDGEQTDSDGLVFLRARYYDSTGGRFLMRDSWGGNEKQPISYNSWLFVFGNPINVTDPTGKYPEQCYHIDSSLWYQVPGCPGYIGNLQAPNTQSYNQSIQPRNITWESNQYADSIDAHGAPGLDERNNPGAQYDVPGHHLYCDKYDNKGHCIGSWHYNDLCGDISVAAILSAFSGSMNTSHVVDSIRELLGLNDHEGTTGPNLAQFINTQKGMAAVVVTPPSSPFWALGQWIKSNLLGRQVIMALTYMKSGTRGVNPTDPNASIPNGRIDFTGTIPHWVVITGISHQWQTDSEDVKNYRMNPGAPPPSPWNWIRVFNPFGNQSEYYWWGDFYPTWNRADSGGMVSSMNSTVLVGPK